MKDEAPPWEGVLPMAQSFVDMASAWLNEEGSHVVTIPDYIDYGARITAPMARRTLSFWRCYKRSNCSWSPIRLLYTDSFRRSIE